MPDRQVEDDRAGQARDNMRRDVLGEPVTGGQLGADGVEPREPRRQGASAPGARRGEVPADAPGRAVGQRRGKHHPGVTPDIEDLRSRTELTSRRAAGDAIPSPADVPAPGGTHERDGLIEELTSPRAASRPKCRSCGRCRPAPSGRALALGALKPGKSTKTPGGPSPRVRTESCGATTR